MQAIREDEEDALGRLERRLEAISEIISGLKRRNAELEGQLREAAAARDAAQAQARSATEEAAQMRDELEGLRSRQKQAATRIKSLLNQVEQMDLLTEG